jgi:curved DNA-binding protein CbpA
VQGFNPDPYEVLGIARDATQRQVKQAYRSLAKKFHPDHNPGNPEAAERFKQIQRAYETLTDRRKPTRMSRPVFYSENYPPSFFKNAHPFFSFYWAMRAHGDRIMKNMQANHPGDEKEKTDLSGRH